LEGIRLEEAVARFLVAFFGKTGADPLKTVSMYALGEESGMDRKEAAAAASELIAREYAEIRSLSGAIGITPAGLEAARKLTGRGGAEGPEGCRLGSGPVAGAEELRAAIRVVDELKTRLGKLGLDFDPLAELFADLRTLEAQAASPRPKTAILRECFRSLRDGLQKAGKPEAAAAIRSLLGE